MPDGRMAANGAVHRARIFTVPPGQPFLIALARAILAGDLPVPGGAAPDPLSLPSYTLLLPTRRAARALHDAFLNVGGGRALLLPRIKPIAEGQEDLDLLEGAAEQVSPADYAGDLPPAISELERRLVLTRLVMAWAEAQRRTGSGEGRLQPFAGVSARTPAQAARLGADLAKLMDAVETENASLAGLDGLVPESLSEHWQTTLEFLKIVTETWPAYLGERGLTSPMTRRNRLVLAEAARLAARPPTGPVVVAGVTGSVPATAELMRSVSRLPQGAIVLPALDQRLDAETWAALTDGDTGHPQLGLRTLLERLGHSREHVTVLPGCSLSPGRALRNDVVAQAMRPAATTVRWRTFASTVEKTAVADALAGVSLIEASREQDEAEAIALILREALETPGRTAALVSPDRLLARRVVTRLQSWGVRVDDSAGRPFAKTVPGAFLDLVAEAISSDFAPAELMALLKHPLTRLGLPVGQMRRAARALEIAAFRSMYLGRGLAGVEAAIERAALEASSGARRDRAIRRLWDADWTAIRDLTRRLQLATIPLAVHFDKRNSVPLATLAAAHIEVAEAFARPAEEGQPSLLWQGEAGEAAAKLFAGLMDEAMPAPLLMATDYPEFYRCLISGESVRPRVPVHPRLSIWGPFEARLQQADVMVLGSLNEGTWPTATEPGAWLNRTMRKALGLPPPEEEIGRAAHDFTTFLGADRVFLTRATKVDGAPTVPSRWLMRLRALLGGLGLNDVLTAREPWLAWGRARNHVEQRHPVAAPEPRPPLALRPRRASVSDVEQWIKNPYAIFARHVLGLEILSPLGAEPGPREKGQVVHEALSRFAARYPEHLPSNVAAELLRAAQEVLQELVGHPRVAAFWLPRLARFADWFAETEPARRVCVDRIVAEVGGELVLEAPAGPFTLRARADRIDATGMGLIITDYKTGALPNDKSVLVGSAPQLPLEAAIVTAGGFERVPARPVLALRYIRATGAEPAGEERVVNAGDVGALAGDALQGLTRLVARFDDPATPYRAVRRARFKYDYDSYAHLARVAEWAGARGEEDE